MSKCTQVEHFPEPVTVRITGDHGEFVVSGVVYCRNPELGSWHSYALADWHWRGRSYRVRNLVTAMMLANDVPHGLPRNEESYAQRPKGGVCDERYA